MRKDGMERWSSRSDDMVAPQEAMGEVARGLHNWILALSEFARQRRRIMGPAYISREQRRTNTIMFFALLFAAAFVLFVMIVTGWGPLPMLAVLAGFGVLGLLHYLVWGRREEENAFLARRRIHRPGS
jgi:hypothetical protein